MKKILTLIWQLTLITALCACNSNPDTNNPEITGNLSHVSQKNLKRYGIRSGIVHYKSIINGKVMGSTITGSGHEDLYFDNWGALELKKKEEKKITHMNIFGHKKTQVDASKSIDKLDNGKSYNVDFKNKIIYVRDDPAMSVMKNTKDADVEHAGKQMLEAMGGKQIGEEKVLGYLCSVWQIPGGKQWIYKGVPLKIQMTVMGITTTQEATSAKFNISVPSKYFELPDYPIEKMAGFGNIGMYDDSQSDDVSDMKNLRKMSYKEYVEVLKKNDPETFQQMSEEELKASYNLMQKMASQMGN